MSLRQAAQQALEALERYRVETPLGHQPHMIAEQADSAITALKQALAEPEPLGWITAGQHTAPLRTHWEGCEAVHPECRKPEQEPDGISWLKRDSGYFTAPTPRKPLTYDELEPLCEAFDSYDTTQNELVEFARAIERAHGIGEQHE